MVVLSAILLYRFKSFPESIRVFSWYIFGSAIIQFTAFVLAKYSINNLALLHVNSLFQLVSLSLFFRVIYSKRILKIGVLAVMIPASITVVWLVLDNGILNFSGLGTFISNACLVLFSTLYFFQTISVTDVQKRGHLLINSGVLLFSAVSMILFLFGDFLTKMELADQVLLWLINAIAYTSFLILVLIELWRYLLRDKKTLSSM